MNIYSINIYIGTPNSLNSIANKTIIIRTEIFIFYIKYLKHLGINVPVQTNITPHIDNFFFYNLPQLNPQLQNI